MLQVDKRGASYVYWGSLFHYQPTMGGVSYFGRGRPRRRFYIHLPSYPSAPAILQRDWCRRTWDFELYVLYLRCHLPDLWKPILSKPVALAAFQRLEIDAWLWNVDYSRFWGCLDVFTLVYCTFPSLWKSTYFVPWLWVQLFHLQPAKIIFMITNMPSIDCKRNFICSPAWSWVLLMQSFSIEFLDLDILTSWSRSLDWMSLQPI